MKERTAHLELGGAGSHLNGLGMLNKWLMSTDSLSQKKAKPRPALE